MICVRGPGTKRGRKGCVGRRCRRFPSRTPGSGGDAIPCDEEWRQQTFLQLAGILESYALDNEQSALSLLAGRLILST